MLTIKTHRNDHILCLTPSETGSSKTLASEVSEIIEKIQNLKKIPFQRVFLFLSPNFLPYFDRQTREKGLNSVRATKNDHFYIFEF